MKWSKGIVEWIEGDTVFLSVVFTWDIEEAWRRTYFYDQLGYQVKVGGPGVYVKTPARESIAEIATIGGSIPDVVARHNPNATFASRGCPVGCWFCIVPSMEGRDFTVIDDFPVRPILCDNNLSALPEDFQDHIISRYLQTETPLLDANSGFEPRTFTRDVFERWRRINKGPWRFALDDQGDLPYVIKVLDMLKVVTRPQNKRVYVLIGNEPFASCMDRIQLVLDRGAEPHVQPLIKLNATDKIPWVRYDWTADLLRQVARWANRRLWKYTDFEGYSRHRVRIKRDNVPQLQFT